MRLLRPVEWFTWLLEPDDRYLATSRLFLRLMALIYLAAFVSAALEITGLVGQDGILPAGDYLAQLEQRFGTAAWVRFPTLFWLDHSDMALSAASYAGCLFAVLLLIGWRPLLTSIVLFVLYLSLFRAGQLFFNFQWDYLLLEAGFLAIFLTGGPNRLLVFLFHWLLFRLRFLSGLSKLLSGDPSWADLTTLRYYFETQPLPHIGGWYAHQLPDWLLRAGTGLTLFVELVVPFFIFLPRPFRLFAAFATILIQLLIIATSNHNFINLLTIALCLFLLDDRALRRFVPAWLSGVGALAAARGLMTALLPFVAAALVLAGGASAYDLISDSRAQRAWNAPLGWVQGWGLGNVYHVFPTMQTERQELIVQGSNDGREWLTYTFRYKPDSPSDYPRFIVPLHPRLDWMIWFVPSQNPAMRPWFERFLWQLGRNSPSVTGLLAHNPFPDAGPRYLRVLAYRYRFSTPQQRARTGQVWQAEYLGLFPAVPPRIP
ncbi:MAG: lipase maturation factor family protein [Gammaproteobacteria bacterium]|nr:lipase maturation factor family protein [Gammaproteobacteria bacterium]